MNRILCITCIVFSLLAAGCGQETVTDGGQAAPQVDMADETQKLSYALGLDMGVRLKDRDVAELDANAASQGLMHGLSGAEGLMPHDEAVAAIARFQEARMAEMRAELAAKAEAMKEAGQAYQEDNKAKEGVTVTETGLQYRVVEAGAGEKPVAGDMVTFHYVGRHTNGTEFDSSYKRGEPVTMPLMGLIPGWKEALMLMPAGSKWELVIPSELAYGESGAAGVIQPNETLIFDVELTDVQKATKEEEAGQ